MSVTLCEELTMILLDDADVPEYTVRGLLVTILMFGLFFDDG